MAKSKRKPALNLSILACSVGDVSLVLEHASAMYGARISIVGTPRPSHHIAGGGPGVAVPTGAYWSYEQLEQIIEHLAAIRERVIADRKAMGLEILTWQQRVRRLARRS